MHHQKLLAPRDGSDVNAKTTRFDKVLLCLRFVDNTWQLGDPLLASPKLPAEPSLP